MRTIAISILLIFGLSFLQIKAQLDTTEFIFIEDSTTILKNTNNLKQNNPKAATLLSILPGGGQAYNKQYWKIPLFYGLLGYQTYNYGLKNKKYHKYLNAYADHLKHDADTSYQLPVFSNDISVLTLDQLKQYKDKYRRSRDLSAVLFIAIYAFNIIDANVYANLSNFDISEDLSISVKPKLIPIYASEINTVGISLKFKF